VLRSDSNADGGGSATPHDKAISCLANVNILLTALDDLRALDDAQARHVTSCQSCREKVARTRRLLGDIAAQSVEMSPPAPAAGPCLGESVLAQLVDGEHTNQRVEHLAHLAACARCREELTALAALLADNDVAAEVRSVEASTRATAKGRRLTIGPLSRSRALGVLTAAAAVLVFARPIGERLASSGLRGSHPTITAIDAPELLSPKESSGVPLTFRWSAVPGSDRYRLTMFDASGRVVYGATVTDTILALPDSVAVVPGATYLWKVEARTDVDRWTPSELTELRIVPLPRAK